MIVLTAAHVIGACGGRGNATGWRTIWGCGSQSTGFAMTVRARLIHRQGVTTSWVTRESGPSYDRMSIEEFGE